MTITPALRNLMKARAEAEAEEAVAKLIRTEAERRMNARFNRTMDAIAAATERLDAEDRGPNKFSRSAIIKIGYCVIATSGAPNAEIRAMEFVRNSLSPGSKPDGRDRATGLDGEATRAGSAP